MSAAHTHRTGSRTLSVAGPPGCHAFFFLCFSCLCFLCLRIFIYTDDAPSAIAVSPPCNFSSGAWVRHHARLPVYDHTCPDIFRGWNCGRNNKGNAHTLVQWRWSFGACNLASLDAVLFLERFRNKSVGFVGDSLIRNMYISLVCILRQSAGKVLKSRPAGADRGLVFLAHNLTISYHRSNLLARHARWEANTQDHPLQKLGFKQGYRVDVDVAQSSWSQAAHLYHLLIINTGHWWWASEKFHPLLFFQGGKPILPPKSPQQGLDLALQHMIRFVEDSMPSDSIRYFTTTSPRHFSGGDWKDGGSCPFQQPIGASEVEEMFAVDKGGVNTEARRANSHIVRAVKGTKLLLLDITQMSEYRADAHPSTSGGKLHPDCMHWCLPGLPDSWNDLLFGHLLTDRRRLGYI